MTVKEYNILVDRHADGLYRFALKSVKNDSLARDIVQETYTKFWTKCENVDFEKGKSYLFTTAYHAIVDALKLEKKYTDHQDVEQYNYSSNFDNFSLKENLDKALETLPAIQKTVILLRDYEGYNYNEIADITNLSESQVKVYIFRGRKALQLYLKDIQLFV